MTFPLLAIGIDNGPLQRALKTILGDALVSTKNNNDVQVIGVVIPNDSDGSDWADQAAAILNRHPKCIGFVVAYDDEKTLVGQLRHGLCAPFGECVLFVKRDGNLLLNLLDKAAELQKCHPSRVAMHRAREVIFAKAIYRRLERFGHGGTRDITNQFLAPLQMLQSMNQDVSPMFTAKIQLLRDFKGVVLGPAMKHGIQGSELRNAFYHILRSRRLKVSGEHLNCLMDILTQCRITAGKDTSLNLLEENSDATLVQRNIKPKYYKLLIIDDHFEDWRPFFAAIQRQVKENLGDNVELTFSPLDCSQSTSIIASALQTLPDYDAVLLDIFLGQNVHGLSLLDSIRKHYVNVPVILWTSSREIDLPAKARLAHGFLFKKTSSAKEITGVLTHQLREGRARRLYPLPGHFFDQSILDEDNRKCALRFTEYCSKQLDSFHALDDQYFRYFTDHGGRHLFKLLEYLGEALRPLVGLDGKDQVFSTNPRQREEEILSLYLAVFLHEFGMLRLQGEHEPVWHELILESKVDNCSKPPPLTGELNLVRQLHAVRGMILLAKNPKDEPIVINNHWPDEEGQHQAHKRFVLQNRPNVHAAVALITGHHSRLLPLDLTKDGVWNHDFKRKYEEKVRSALEPLEPALSNRLLEVIPKRFYAFNAVETVLLSLIDKIQDSDRLERLRKQCAIFRFVDAIDVDHSRNPARFLCVAGKISNIDRRETLKRQVIRKVKIEGGTVHMQTNVPPPSSHDVLKAIGIQARLKPEDTQLKELLAQFAEQPDVLQQWIKNPWQHPCEKSRDWRILCHKTLDGWLANFWSTPWSYESEGLLKKSGEKYTDESKLLIASFTALSVAWEILDEYKAISDCNLAGQIRLGDFWRNTARDGVYNPESQEKMLTILFHPQEGLDNLIK